MIKSVRAGDRVRVIKVDPDVGKARVAMLMGREGVVRWVGDRIVAVNFSDLHPDGDSIGTYYFLPKWLERIGK